MILKLKYPFLFLFIFTIHTTISQNIRIGIEGGPSISSIRGNEIVEENESLISFEVGGSIEYFFSESLSLKSGFIFEKKGYETESVIDNYGGIPHDSYQVKATYNYLTIPLFVKYQFGNKLKIFFNGGSYLSYLLSSKSKVRSFGSSDHSELNNSLDLGISLGTGVLFPLSEEFDLSFEFRDNLGLINISKADIINNGSLKTNSLNFLLGVNLKI